MTIELDNIKKKINNKIICIVLHGKSIEKLENRIEEFNSDNICWISLNAYDIVEDYILNKINKKLDIIYCGANYTPDAEETRIPKLIKSLDEGILVIAKEYLFTKIFPKFTSIDLYNKYKEQILLLENIFNKEDKSLFEILSTYTVSSLGYLLSVLSIIEAKTIILFGLDGCIEKETDLLGTYYKPDIHRKRRKMVTSIKSSIQSDTIIFNTKYNNTYLSCMKQFNIIDIPKIYNCSPESNIKTFSIINYDEAVKLC